MEAVHLFSPIAEKRARGYLFPYILFPAHPNSRFVSIIKFCLGVRKLDCVPMVIDSVLCFNVHLLYNVCCEKLNQYGKSFSLRWRAKREHKSRWMINFGEIMECHKTSCCAGVLRIVLVLLTFTISKMTSAHKTMILTPPYEVTCLSISPPL